MFLSNVLFDRAEFTLQNHVCKDFRSFRYMNKTDLKKEPSYCLFTFLYHPLLHCDLYSFSVSANTRGSFEYLYRANKALRNKYEIIEIKMLRNIHPNHKTILLLF